MSTAVSSSKTLLLSIQPRFAELILAGSKTVELRKRPPLLPTGSLVVMYASSPTRALVGAFVLDGIVAMKPAKLWRRLGTQTGVTRETYERYYAGREQAYGLLITDVVPFERAVSLTALRERWGKFHPPQSYRYLRSVRSGDTLSLALPGGGTSLSARAAC